MFHQMLLEESDRGCVLVGASILNEDLEILLRKKFSSEKKVVKDSVNSLFFVMGPLASFWSKIQLSNALMLLPDGMYNDLEIIRKIRNKFAHHHEPVDFNNTEIISLIEKLNYGQVLRKLQRYGFNNKNSENFKLPPDYVMQEKGYVKRGKSIFAVAVNRIHASFFVLSEI